MRLFFLGTAAAEGYPGLFCDCDNCKEARALGGKNLRFRSALLVNDDLLIDFGPDLLASALRFNVNLSRVTTALVTHAHLDHFFHGNVRLRREDFTARRDIPTLSMFSPCDVTSEIEQQAPDQSLYRIEAQTVRAFDSWSHCGYRFTAYRANHALELSEALFYSVEDGERAFLYATDTGSFPEATWAALAGKSFDAVILEETLGTGVWAQHLGYDTFLEHAQRMRAEGMLKPGGRLIAHHMSHTSNPVHEKVEAVLNPHGVEVAYDGMEVIL